MKILKNFFFTIFFCAIISKEALACACGCGIFDVATSALIPNCAGGLAFLQYDYINQNHNWHNKDKAASDANHDKQIKTQTLTAGLQYMFNREFGAALRIPYVERSATITEHHEDETEHQSENLLRDRSLGDIKINGIYSGFSSEMNSGLTFGLKLPSGNSNHSGLARDTQIGTGSTDSLLGFYHVNQIGNSERLNHFFQISWQRAFLTHNDYRPGTEISMANGISYNLGQVFGIKKVTPILQLNGSRKSADSGANSDPKNSGYSQIFISPALEFSFTKFKIYADVEFPIYRNFNGNQLVAQRLFKLILGYNF